MPAPPNKEVPLSLELKILSVPLRVMAGGIAISIGISTYTKTFPPISLESLQRYDCISQTCWDLEKLVKNTTEQQLNENTQYVFLSDKKLQLEETLKETVREREEISRTTYEKNLKNVVMRNEEVIERENERIKDTEQEKKETAMFLIALGIISFLSAIVTHISLLRKIPHHNPPFTVFKS